LRACSITNIVLKSLSMVILVDMFPSPPFPRSGVRELEALDAGGVRREELLEAMLHIMAGLDDNGCLRIAFSSAGEGKKALISCCRGPSCVGRFYSGV
jgi:hypothetical protein